MLMIWFERKVISDLQNRIGPNRAGPFGILQTLADGLKVLLKEDLIPDKADRWVFRLAPILTMVPAFIIFGDHPARRRLPERQRRRHHGLRPRHLPAAGRPHAGVLVILAMSSIAVYGVMLAGWSSGSKYPLLGSVRASAQMVSYEAALGLVGRRRGPGGGLAHHQRHRRRAGPPGGWNLWVTGLIPFVIFCLSATAELNRPPFDLVEAEQELVGGFHTEYSGFRFAIFFLAEFLNAVTMGAIIVTLFLGGPNGPILGVLPGWLWGTIWFVLKLVAVLFVFVWFRATVPRVRYDQLMDLGWKVLIPLVARLAAAARRPPGRRRRGLEPASSSSPSASSAMAACYGLLRLGHASLPEQPGASKGSID